MVDAPTRTPEVRSSEPLRSRDDHRLSRGLLHAESLTVAATAIVVYLHLGYPWWLLLVLALAPDLSMLAYIAGPSVGALGYGLKYPTGVRDTHLQRV